MLNSKEPTAWYPIQRNKNGKIVNGMSSFIDGTENVFVDYRYGISDQKNELLLSNCVCRVK